MRLRCCARVAFTVTFYLPLLPATCPWNLYSLLAPTPLGVPLVPRVHASAVLACPIWRCFHFRFSRTGSLKTLLPSCQGLGPHGWYLQDQHQDNTPAASSSTAELLYLWIDKRVLFGDRRVCSWRPSPCLPHLPLPSRSASYFVLSNRDSLPYRPGRLHR